MKERKFCKASSVHNILFDYGFGERGLGGYVRCSICSKVLMFQPEKKHTYNKMEKQERLTYEKEI